MSGEADRAFFGAGPSFGMSRASGELHALIAQVASTHSPVLVRGEPGTRKIEVARQIHAQSTRAAKPFVVVGRSELTEAFIEYELFGRSQQDRDDTGHAGLGRLHMANGGTVFIEELRDLPTGVQARLSRFMDDGVVSRGPGVESLKADVRLVAATDMRDPSDPQAGIRSDLYERFAAFTIEVPPLRECKADILRLAQKHLIEFAEELGKPARRMSSHAAAALLCYPWPQNALELEQCMKRAVILCESELLGMRHLPVRIQGIQEDESAVEESLQATLDAIERALIMDALKATRGNQAKAAEILGLTERLMGLRVRKHGIDPRTFRI